MNGIIASLCLLFFLSVNVFSWESIPSVDDIFFSQDNDLIISGTVVNSVAMMDSQSGEVQIISVLIDNIYHKSTNASHITSETHPDTIFVVMELTRPSIVPPAVQEVIDQRRTVRPGNELIFSLSATKSRWIFTFSDPNHPILKLYENDDLEKRLFDQMPLVGELDGQAESVDADSTDK